MKKLVFGLMTCILLLGCSSSSQEDTTFIVGMECGYSPYNWTTPAATETSVEIDGGQHCDGYDVQIAKKIASSLGKELVVKKISWEGLLLSLESQQIDAIIAGMSPTDERKESVNFSDLYYKDETGFGVIVLKEGPYKNSQNTDEFSKARVAAQIGTFHMELLDQLTGIEKVENMSTFATMTVALQSGEINAFISDASSASSIVASNNDLKYIQLDQEKGFMITDAMAGVAIGVNKDNPQLLSDINEALSTITTDERNALMKEAIGQNFTVERTFFEEVIKIFNDNKKIFFIGTINTLIIATLSTFFGFLIGLLISIVRDKKLGNIISTIYVTLFRGTPMMVQAMVIYYGASRLFEGFSWNNIYGGSMIAGILIVSINTGAYMAETIRGGIQSLDKGQFEAAKCLGFTRWQTMKTIILPQAIRNIIPAIGNEFIVNVKDTSVLNMISVTELFFISNGIAATTWKIFETFTITACIYLVLTTIFTILLNFVEHKLDRTKTRAASFSKEVE